MPHVQMEEEGVPSTTLREISLLQMLSESNHIVKCARRRGWQSRLGRLCLTLTQPSPAMRSRSTC
jgi:hypothetical protein